jgi:hypothetical protein
MSEDNNFVCAILAFDTPLNYISSDDPRNIGTPSKVQQLLDDLKQDGCEEFGEPSVKAMIVIDADTNVHDIRLNDQSIGYFGVLTFCKAYGLNMAEKLRHGEFNEEQLKAFSNERPITIIPLFQEEV